MAQDMTGKYTTPVARPNQPFSLFKTPTGEDTMSTSAANTTSKATTSTSTGAAAKAARQAKLTVVRPETGAPEAAAQLTDTDPAPETAICPRCESAMDATALGETGMCVPCEEETLAERTTDLPLPDLLAARRALDAQIKAAKAAAPAKPAKQPKTLATVIAAQLARPRTDAPRIICTYVLAREAAGQERATAVEEVLGQMRSIVLGSLDARRPGESYHQAIFRYLGRTDMLAQPDASDATGDEPDTGER
jgi:hypothetical protein